MGTVLSVAAVGQDTCIVVENVRNGTLTRLTPGIHILPPLVYRFRYVNWHFTDDIAESSVCGCDLPLYDICYDPPPLVCRTSDGVNVGVDLVLYFCVEDAIAAVSKVDNLYLIIQNHVQTATYRAVLELGLDDVTSTGIEKLMNPKNLSLDLARWGVAVRRIEVQKIDLPKTISEATTSTLAARRKGEAELVKLEQEHTRRVRMAQTELAEQDARQQREQAAHAHAIRLKEEESERAARVLVRDAEAEAAATRQRGEAEAHAIAVKAGATNEAMRTEHEILAAHPNALPFFEKRVQAEAWGAVASSSNTKLVVAPGDALLAAARNPLSQVFASLQASADGNDERS